MKTSLQHAFILLITAALGFTSCTNAPQGSSNTSTNQVKENDVDFVFQPEYTSIKWTAYKFTKRTGVSGSFSTYKVELGTNRKSPKDALTGLRFSIATASNDSKNEERDGKIAEHFFGTMMDTERIRGNITSVSGSDTSGTARISITMNQQTHEVDAKYTISNNEVKINANLHMGDWKAEPSIDALNKVCETLHTGEDGISILWPDVDVEVISTLREL